MNCERWEKMAALAVEGDLPDQELPELERHLAGCAACRDFADGLSDTQAALHDLREEAIGPEAYREVRQAVLRRIGDRQRDWRMWYAIAAALILAAVLAGFEWSRHRSVERLMPLRATAVGPVGNRRPIVNRPLGTERPATIAVHSPPTHRRRRVVPPAERQQSAEPLVVKLVSDDPDVIIYWLVDRQGE